MKQKCPRSGLWPRCGSGSTSEPSPLTKRKSLLDNPGLGRNKACPGCGCVFSTTQQGAGTPWGAAVTSHLWVTTRASLSVSAAGLRFKFAACRTRKDDASLLRVMVPESLVNVQRQSLDFPVLKFELCVVTKEAWSVLRSAWSCNSVDGC